MYIYPTRIAERFRMEYPCILALQQRPVHLAQREDIVIGPADHPCPSELVEHAFVWQLDTRSARRYRGNCSRFAHNAALADAYKVPSVRLYITPSTARFCEGVMAEQPVISASSKNEIFTSQCMI